MLAGLEEETLLLGRSGHPARARAGRPRGGVPRPEQRRRRPRPRLRHRAGPDAAAPEPRHRARRRPPRARRARLHQPRLPPRWCCVRTPRPTPTSPPASPTASTATWTAWSTYMSAWLATSLCQQGRLSRGDTLGPRGDGTTRTVAGQPDSRRSWSSARSPCGGADPSRPRASSTRHGTWPGRDRGVAAHRARSHWQGRRPRGCAVTVAPWPASSPSRGARARRSSPPSNAGSSPGGCRWRASSRGLDPRGWPRPSGSCSRATGWRGRGLGGRRLPLVAGREPGPLRRPSTTHARPASCCARWAPTRRAWPCSGTATRPGCPCRAGRVRARGGTLAA